MRFLRAWLFGSRIESFESLAKPHQCGQRRDRGVDHAGDEAHGHLVGAVPEGDGFLSQEMELRFGLDLPIAW